MAKVTMTMEEIKKIMTPERIRRETEEALTSPPVFDPDCPPLTEDMIKARNFHRVSTKGKYESTDLSMQEKLDDINTTKKNK